MSEKCHFCEHERGPLMDEPEACKTCHNCNHFEVKKNLPPVASWAYEKLKKEEEWINDQSVEYDRDTALAVLNAISKHMRPSLDLFGNKILTIDRYRFEAVRKKFLDRKEKRKNGKEVF